MSQYSITQYYNALERIIDFGGTRNETSIRTAFHILLNEYARGKGLELVTEVAVMGTNGKDVRPDGVLKDTLRQEWGCWESKDESDDIDEEIAKKFAKGYPKENILFEDSNTAVLFQDGKEAIRVSMKDPEALDHIINAFIKYERPEIKKFHLAIEQFKQDIPKVTETLRQIIKEQEENRNETFIKAAKKFLKLCHDSINPDVTMDDVHEMIIQHILTEDIFNVIFDEIQFHKENNIAHELEKVIHTFFTGHIKRTALSKVQSYYQAINANAAGIADHHEKQKFLKVVYETFYKSYNPKAADRLGVVYTPNEIVRFMVQSTDYLLHKHFNKKLEDKGVEMGRFKGIIGKEFSENILFKNTMESCLSSRYNSLLFFDDDNPFNPDCYYRKGNHIFLIEFKDYLLNSEVIQSGSYDTIEQAIREKFIEVRQRDRNKIKAKGVSQLARNLEYLLSNPERFWEIDEKARNKKLKLRNMIIHPVIVQTSIHFDFPALNEYLDQAFQGKVNDIRTNFRAVHPITMIHFDYFFDKLLLFADERLNLIDEVEFYHQEILRRKKKAQRSLNPDDWFQSYAPFSFVQSPEALKEFYYRRDEVLSEIRKCWNIL